MAAKWLPVSLSLVALAACALGAAIMPATRTCHQHAALCIDRGALHDGGMMALPAVGLLLIGLRAGLRQIVRTHRALRGLRRSLRPPSGAIAALARSLGLHGRIDVVDAEGAQVFCYGLVRPRVVVTSALLAVLDPTELAAVLCHERHHVQRWDPLRVVGWTVLRRACPWLEEDAQRADLGRELAADRAAIAALGRAPLASALLKLIERRQPPTPALAVSGLSVTAARIDQVTSAEPGVLPRPRLTRILLLPLLMLVTLLLCSLGMSHLRP
jgi:Zn-dependent protease with chaperone function